MKKLLLTLLPLLTVFVFFATTMQEAQAARLGGSRSVGMQRQSAPIYRAPTRQVQPTPAPAPTAPTPAPRRSWMGPLAGLAAGLGLGALMSHFGMGGVGGGFLMVILLVAGIVLISRLFAKRPPANQGMQYAHDSSAYAPTQNFDMPPNQGAATTPEYAPNIPDGFNSDEFLRIAKLNFLRLQAANDEGNLDDMREFLAPEIFAEVKMQLAERGTTPQKTDVVTLEAQLLEVVTEGHRHIASVRFSGLIRETEGATAAPFNEIWHLIKPVDATRGWTVAGIQQIEH